MEWCTCTNEQLDWPLPPYMTFAVDSCNSFIYSLQWFLVCLNVTSDNQVHFLNCSRCAIIEVRLSFEIMWTVKSETKRSESCNVTLGSTPHFNARNKNKATKVWTEAEWIKLSCLITVFLRLITNANRNVPCQLTRPWDEDGVYNAQGALDLATYFKGWIVVISCCCNVKNWVLRALYCQASMPRTHHNLSPRSRSRTLATRHLIDSSPSRMIWSSWGGERAGKNELARWTNYSKKRTATNTPKCTGIDTETQRHRHRDTPQTNLKDFLRGVPWGLHAANNSAISCDVSSCQSAFPLYWPKPLRVFFFFFSLSILFHALPGPPSYKFQVRKDWVQCKKQVISIGSCGKTTFYFKKLRTTCLM